MFIYRQHIPKIAQKKWLFCNREHPNLFIQWSSLNTKDDPLFMKRISPGRMKAAAFGKKWTIFGWERRILGKKGQNLFFSAELAWMQSYSHVRGIGFIKLTGENSGVWYYLLQVLYSELRNIPPTGHHPQLSQKPNFSHESVMLRNWPFRSFRFQKKVSFIFHDGFHDGWNCLLTNKIVLIMGFVTVMIVFLLAIIVLIILIDLTFCNFIVRK